MFTMYDLRPEAKSMSAIFGGVLIALALAMRQPATRVLWAILLFCGSALGLFGYAAFAYLGIEGFDTETDFGYVTHVEFSPDVGLVACVAGCLIAWFAAVAALRSTTVR